MITISYYVTNEPRAAPNPHTIELINDILALTKFYVYIIVISPEI
jgi:hypothetical protein